MKKSLFVILISFASLLLWTGSTTKNLDKAWNGETPVAEVLQDLGDYMPPHYMEPDMAFVSKGMELVISGITTTFEGGKTKKQSLHYTCTDCHNLVKEDPVLSISDPETRLKYAAENKLPFLQATTLYGVVNRETWYNGDYYTKYGPDVQKASKNIVDAIQLCAKVCSQGRYFNDWELKAVLAYLWSIQLKMQDLHMSETDWDRLLSLQQSKKAQPELKELVKSYYLMGSPAKFGDAPQSYRDGYPLKGNPDNGELIYELSCRHCHNENGISFFVMDDASLTHKFLKKKAKKDSRYNLYKVIRYGTPSTYGEKAYMPNYTLNRMSDQQVEDLRAFIEQKAG